jgi:hypothetical protein
MDIKPISRDSSVLYAESYASYFPALANIYFIETKSFFRFPLNYLEVLYIENYKDRCVLFFLSHCNRNYTITLVHTNTPNNNIVSLICWIRSWKNISITWLIFVNRKLKWIGLNRLYIAWNIWKVIICFFNDVGE